MDELIRRKDALNALNLVDAPFLPMNTNEHIAYVYALKNLPSVDAVEVVRCKDCKYFELNHWDGIIITAHEICNKWADGCKTNKDGYCFLGERKTDDS